MARCIVAAFCLLGLAACDESMMIASPAPTTAEPASGLPDPAVATCMSAVAQQTRSGIVAPLKVTHGLTDRTVVLAVGENRTLWECRVNGAGAVVAAAPTGGVAPAPTAEVAAAG